MSVSPPANRKSGPGEGIASARRSTATIDTPVSVRIRVSPSTRPFQYDVAANSIRSATSPSWWSTADSSCDAGIIASMSVSASPEVSRTDKAHASGSSSW